MSYRLKRALLQRRQAERRVETTLEKEYPVGAGICWRRNTSAFVQKGQVISHSRDRVRVVNRISGREYWITAFDVCEAL